MTGWRPLRGKKVKNYCRVMIFVGYGTCLIFYLKVRMDGSR